MDHFTEWCLICERKLPSEGIYCSLNCLKQDFIESTRAEYGPAGNKHEQKLQADQSSLGIPMAPPHPYTHYHHLQSAAPASNCCPPSPSLSVGGMSDTSSIASAASNLSEAAHAILAPPFSLEFKSRGARRRPHSTGPPASSVLSASASSTQPSLESLSRQWLQQLPRRASFYIQ
ncbi:hypothetical protein BC830DRAFT_1133847 [Chytriomyces sp. MP71]|nr:hypothetical protein BC830DRAFT_1133847 [Chytriomyces sp. MP71]